MEGILALDNLLSALDPEQEEEVYVFCTCKKDFIDVLKLNPWAIIREEEGITVILEKEKAIESGIKYEGSFRCITLKVHSSLQSVGMTAVITTELAKNNISANIVAGYYHDHIFVQENRAEEAIKILKSFKKATI